MLLPQRVHTCSSLYLETSSAAPLWPHLLQTLLKCHFMKEAFPYSALFFFRALIVTYIWCVYLLFIVYLHWLECNSVVETSKWFPMILTFQYSCPYIIPSAWVWAERRLISQQIEYGKSDWTSLLKLGYKRQTAILLLAWPLAQWKGPHCNELMSLANNQEDVRQTTTWVRWEIDPPLLDLEMTTALWETPSHRHSEFPSHA